MTSVTVPYRSQWDADGNAFRTDCGPTCCAMLLEWAGKGVFTINALSEETGLTVHDVGLNPSQLVALLAKHGLFTIVHPATLDNIRAEIDAGRPVIALVTYGYIPERQDSSDIQGGHYVVVTGYQGEAVILNDPDFWGGTRDRGHGLVIKATELSTAIQHSPLPGQCIFVRSQAQTPPPTILGHVISPLNLRERPGLGQSILAVMPGGSVVLVDANTTTVDGVVWVRTLFGNILGYAAAPYINTNLVKDVPPGSVWTGPAHTHTPNDVLNVRSAPGGNIVGKLGDGTSVIVLSDTPVLYAGLVWVKIAGGWVAKKYLLPGNIVPVPAPTPTRRNFVGFHILPGPDTGALEDTIGRLAKSGRPVPIVTVVNDPQLAERIKESSPKTVVVFRYEDGTNPHAGESAQDWWSRRTIGELGAEKTQYPPDYFQFANEWLEDWTAFVKFYNDLMDIATAHQVHITIGDLPEGNGDQHMAALTTKAAAGGHVFNYHAYSQPSAAGDASMMPDVQDLELRWVPWLKASNAKILFGEAGNGSANFLGVEHTIALMKEFNAIMSPYGGYIIGGGAWWTFGGQNWNWARSSVDAMLSAYEAWVGAM